MKKQKREKQRKGRKEEERRGRRREGGTGLGERLELCGKFGRKTSFIELKKSRRIL